jgi:hypothetical protein
MGVKCSDVLAVRLWLNRYAAFHMFADDLRGVMGVNCSDVLAVRLWLDQKLPLRSPGNVVAGFDEGVGGTFFQLDSLQVNPSSVVSNSTVLDT